MHTYRKILLILLFGMIATYSCKKKSYSAGSKEPVDSIVGSYVGITDQNWNITHNDTIFIMKKTDKSFCCYAPMVPYLWGAGEELSCFDYNNSNSYSKYGIDVDFFLQTDSIYYYQRATYHSSGGVINEYIIKFKGKKVK